MFSPAARTSAPTWTSSAPARRTRGGRRATGYREWLKHTGQAIAAAPPLAVAPFDAAKAKEHQDAWAKHLGVEPEITNSIGMKLRLIPPGEFLMGWSPEEIARLLKEAPDLKDAPDHIKDNVRSEGPQRRVTVKEPFYMGVHEVTVGQFREFVRTTKHRTEAETGQGGVTWNDDLKKWERKPENVWDNAELSGGDTHPVVFVTLADAQAFCALVDEARRSRLCGARGGTMGMGLPRRHHDPLVLRRQRRRDEGLWLDDAASEAKRRPVGRLAPNPFGLYDIHGNVQELTISLQEQTIFRGGQAGESPQRARSASRVGVGKQYDPAIVLGFRVVIVGDLKAKTPAKPSALRHPRQGRGRADIRHHGRRGEGGAIRRHDRDPRRWTVRDSALSSGKRALTIRRTGRAFDRS